MADGQRFQIRDVATEHDVAHAAALFRAYQALIGVDLGYQGFDEEVRTLPGKYAATARGALLLVERVDGAAEGAVACGALRATVDPGIAEMKRLYVRPEAQGNGLGRLLVAALLERARVLGYSAVRLDTLPTMTAAVTLYQAAGFRDIAPYYDTPIAGTVFLERRV